MFGAEPPDSREFGGSTSFRRAVRDFRGHFVVELLELLSSYSWSPNRAVLDTSANMVSRTKERAIDPLLVPALLALATPTRQYVD